jgi:hypothetical protein
MPGTDLEISDNAFAEAVRRRCDCGQDMRKVDRHTFTIGEPPVVRVTWKCEACGAVETVRYSDDYEIKPGR